MIQKSFYILAAAFILAGAIKTISWIGAILFTKMSHINYFEYLIIFAGLGAFLLILKWAEKN